MDTYYISLYCIATNRHIASYYSKIIPSNGYFIILNGISEKDRNLKFEVKEILIKPLKDSNGSNIKIKGYLMELSPNDI